MKHPAKYSDSILEELKRLVRPEWRVLDPFAGTGRIHLLGCDSWGVEIEPEWAALHPRTLCGDALHLPFGDSTFDAVVTSPCYGNRMADHHEAKEKCKQCEGVGSYPKFTRQVCNRCNGDGANSYKRITYKHTLGRDLHPASAGKLQWGVGYREFHAAAWREARRVLVPGGTFVLNVSDHVRGGVVQPVTNWHLLQLCLLGFNHVDVVEVPTPRMRFGANGGVRVEHETVATLVAA